MKIEQLSLLSETKISPDYLVTQSNTLIEAPQDLTLQEKRIVLTLASLVQPEDENFRIHRIRVKDLADIIGINEKNFYKKVEEVIRNLQNKSVTIETEKSTLTMHWLSSSEYFKGKGWVELEFSEKLKPYLLELKDNYTPFKLRNVLRLRSEYSIRIYELLKQFEKLKERTFTISELKYYLAIPESKYQAYGHLKSKVLLKAQSELQEKTDLSFEFTEIKQVKKVVGIRFKIKRNNQVLEEVIENEELNKDVDAYSLLIRFGIRPDAARKLLDQYSTKRIKDNVFYTIGNKKKDDIDNISGYILSAIQGDYAESDTQQDGVGEEQIVITEAAVLKWGKSKYKKSTSTVPAFLIEDDFKNYLNELTYNVQEIEEIWTLYGEILIKTVKEIVRNNQQYRSRR
ncbi:replication initiation protein [Bacillus alkalicellulosilyticus]|uniref:replication initiation protein n=1 Tax=Alkalihalobacterium alkalicellulosilyticum TaxID=1912214 RepID=UPI0009973ED5|nr:replication initiation protein [Bacillus alkalicellulosilyticus]